MNRIMLLAVMVVSMQQVTAQTFDEWFRQRKTQRKYLIQQIAALKVYLGYLKEGYKIVDKGMTVVGDIRQGKFDLDIAYLFSLKNVNPAVDGSSKIAGIVTYQLATMREFRELKKTSNESELLTIDEKRYISDVYSNMLKESELSLQELGRMLSNADLELKDDERIKRIDLLYVDMKDKYGFTKSFSNSTRLLIAQRSANRYEISVQEKLVKN